MFLKIKFIFITVMHLMAQIQNIQKVYIEKCHFSCCWNVNYFFVIFYNCFLGFCDTFGKIFFTLRVKTADI